MQEKSVLPDWTHQKANLSGPFEIIGKKSHTVAFTHNRVPLIFIIDIIEINHLLKIESRMETRQFDAQF